MPGWPEPPLQRSSWALKHDLWNDLSKHADMTE